MKHVPADVQSLLHTYVKEIQEQLPTIVTGLYLQGSIVLDAYEEGKSDIDFVTTTARPITEDEALMIKGIHEKLEQTCIKPKMDGFYVQASQPLAEGYFYNEGSFGKAVHDVPVTWWVLKNKGITILGPSIETLPVEANTEKLLSYVKENMQSYWGTRVVHIEQSVEKYAAAPTLLIEEELEWTVLGLLRQFYTLKERDIISKLGAGEYGLQKIEQQWHPLIKEACNIRTGNSERFYPTNEERLRAMIRFGKELIYC
ncbi:hypothetical protein FIU87_02540 [Bacillus sp. THAF10]|uniref:aminoglycoside adenylyltransferase domain-containing protein n=1 Tax=Bacillus sp. THAF10 TaxID=2587848 RepID=UPI001268EC49|nr:aminoglycoside adenylyltransferase domain-containing protein [Bacillus sp. THAF10]QFT87518.1 hypothetical protein FIU87_02540 [Bacillus sp. THAF10]